LQKFKAHQYPLNVGLYITAAYWFIASINFANPAATLARSLSDTFAGIRPADVAGFVAARIASARLVIAFDRWLSGPTMRT
jgi:glycerol uptake facilitator-like aquaporin